MMIHDKKPKIRLYVTDSLNAEGNVTLNVNQTHYIRNVMRLGVGNYISVFNGQDGEWVGQISRLTKKVAEITLEEQNRPQHDINDLRLLFAPIKKNRMDFIIEKATELGVSYLQPVTTDRVQTSRLKYERLEMQAVEAAEQCERLDVPEILEMKPLIDILDNWSVGGTLFICEERSENALPIAQALTEHKTLAPIAFLIGPEGGFSAKELERIHQYPFVRSISMGRCILRAETAVSACLSCYQAIIGNWK